MIHKKYILRISVTLMILIILSVIYYFIEQPINVVIKRSDFKTNISDEKLEEAKWILIKNDLSLENIQILDIRHNVDKDYCKYDTIQIYSKRYYKNLPVFDEALEYNFDCQGYGSQWYKQFNKDRQNLMNTDIITEPKISKEKATHLLIDKLIDVAPTSKIKKSYYTLTNFNAELGIKNVPYTENDNYSSEYRLCWFIQSDDEDYISGVVDALSGRVIILENWIEY